MPEVIIEKKFTPFIPLHERFLTTAELQMHDQALRNAISFLMRPDHQEFWTATDHLRAVKTIDNLKGQIEWVRGQLKMAKAA